jgi:plasmid stability protein
MVSMTLKNIPEDIYLQLKEAAALHHRSLNSEILYCLERSLGTHKIDVEDHLSKAKQLREKTTKLLLTDSEINIAKSDGRP